MMLETLRQIFSIQHREEIQQSYPKATKYESHDVFTHAPVLLCSRLNAVFFVFMLVQVIC